jgi:aryl-alcohol dehydrogenase-like predicted oxidoreductase
MIDKMPFGRTGHNSSRVIFGAAAFGGVTQAEADSTMELLLQYGVNHIDTAASYGASEERIGPFMEKHRAEFFLATKTGERTYQKARDEIHRSLERLRVEQVDLLQLHCLVDLQEWETALGPGGALEAAIEAREAGLVRFIGVTGHGLPVAERHVMSLQRFDFDSVLLPWSYIMMKNTQYAADFAALRQLCGERGIAMQTIKAVSRRPWGEQTHSHSTWYQPIEEQGALDKAAHWVLGHSDLFLNSVGDIHILPLLLDAASRFEQVPSDAEMQLILEQQAMEPIFA